MKPTSRDRLPFLHELTFATRRAERLAADLAGTLDDEGLMGLIAMLRLVSEVTAGHMRKPGANRVQWRVLADATIPGIGAAVMKATTARPFRRWWYCSWNGAESRARLAQAWHRAQQSLGVRVMRTGEQLAHRCF